ncbi:hypothetical protein FcAc13_09780 [Frischella sp. Ac13]|uniref:Uncharacterized protein n=1 Tax=Frischella japonica TaxID=2741544 RepID=A0ABR7QZF5_9GAMM|nr:hypothetical protein [Frischella japonica]MBC9131591.1 hypothetical protein [Frischella japonica]
MKNLTLKKVAIGLLLAGYSISGAYAANSITTGIIKGRAPLVNAKNKTTAVYDKNSITVKLFDKNDNAVAQANTVTNGYKIRIYFNVVDQDGDKDSLQLTAKTIKFGYNKLKQDRSREFVWVASGSVGTDNDGDYAQWIIPQDAVGSHIYYEILANTDFGNPSVASQYVYGDVFKSDDAGLKDNSGDTPAATNVGSGSTDIPSITNGEIGLDSDSYTIELYAISVNSGVITYSANSIGANDSPVVGLLYAPKVTSTEITNADITNQFKFEWNLVDFTTNRQDIVNSGQPANVPTPSQPDITQLDAVNARQSSGGQQIEGLYYQIPVNGLVSANGQTVQNLVAGAQGYKLKVIASEATPTN